MRLDILVDVEVMVDSVNVDTEETSSRRLNSSPTQQEYAYLPHNGNGPFARPLS